MCVLVLPLNHNSATGRNPSRLPSIASVNLSRLSCRSSEPDGLSTKNWIDLVVANHIRRHWLSTPPFYNVGIEGLKPEGGLAVGHSKNVELTQAIRAAPLLVHCIYMYL